MSFKFLFFSFKGRLNRRPYWLCGLASVAAYLCFFPSTAFLGKQVGSENLVIALALVGLVVGVMVSLALGIKRCHDRNKSGWWLLVYWVLPTILQLLDGLLKIEGLHGDGGLFASMISIWAFVDLGCLRGTVGDNRFGPDPLAEDAAPAPASVPSGV